MDRIKTVVSSKTRQKLSLAGKEWVKKRCRDKYGRFLPGLIKEPIEEIEEELHEFGCINLIEAMLLNINHNINTPNRITLSRNPERNIVYIEELIQWIKQDNFWINAWSDIFGYDEYKVKDALINKACRRIKLLEKI